MAMEVILYVTDTEGVKVLSCSIRTPCTVTVKNRAHPPIFTVPMWCTHEVKMPWWAPLSIAVILWDVIPTAVREMILPFMHMVIMQWMESISNVMKDRSALCIVLEMRVHRLESAMDGMELCVTLVLFVNVMDRIVHTYRRVDRQRNRSRIWKNTHFRISR